jgi:hypothetical protein
MHVHVHVALQGHLPFMDRPLLVMAWLHELLLQRQTEGGLRMPAPILSRVYAVSGALRCAGCTVPYFTVL